jgi:hypothetical protein
MVICGYNRSNNKWIVTMRMFWRGWEEAQPSTKRSRTWGKEGSSMEKKPVQLGAPRASSHNITLEVNTQSHNLSLSFCNDQSRVVDFILVSTVQ